MAESSGGERTEKATPRRRDQARKKGQVARSAEINSTLVLLTGATLVLITTGYLTGLLQQNAIYLFSQAHVLRADNMYGLRTLVSGNLTVILKALAPLMTAVLVAGFFANVIQVGLKASTEALAFRPEKLNPITGMKRFVNKKALFELVKNVTKIALIATVAWSIVSKLLPTIATAPLLPLSAITGLGRHAFAELMYKLLAMLAVLALLDWVFQKWQHEESIKMSRVETKQERKDTEGDPQIRARIRAIQFETARKRMLADVPTADVVITNPDHLAVALKYEASDPAPRVVAKGSDRLAEKIKKIAREYRVPVLENKPVARALYRHSKVGSLIPESLYQVVAEILAYVYRLRKS